MSGLTWAGSEFMNELPYSGIYLPDDSDSTANLDLSSSGPSPPAATIPDAAITMAHSMATSDAVPVAAANSINGSQPAKSGDYNLNMLSPFTYNVPTTFFPSAATSSTATPEAATSEATTPEATTPEAATSVAPPIVAAAAININGRRPPEEALPAPPAKKAKDMASKQYRNNAAYNWEEARKAIPSIAMVKMTRAERTAYRESCDLEMDVARNDTQGEVLKEAVKVAHIARAQAQELKALKAAPPPAVAMSDDEMGQVIDALAKEQRIKSAILDQLDLDNKILVEEVQRLREQLSKYEPAA